jgi:hypothetical protein
MDINLEVDSDHCPAAWVPREITDQGPHNTEVVSVPWSVTLSDVVNTD